MMKTLCGILLALIVACSWLTSCNSGGCTENRNAVPLAAFMASSTAQAIQLDSLEISGVDAPGDSILSSPGRSISQVYLPMRPTKPSVSWCIAYKWKNLDNPSLNDTITFDYESIPYFASDECGAYFRYDIRNMSYTTHLIDSIQIVDSLITNIDRVYLNIFFRVGQEQQ